MKFFYSLTFLSINLLVQQLLSSEVLSCNTYSKIDSISYLYYRGIAFVLTSNGYYYVIREDDIHTKDVKHFPITGIIPHLNDCCDSSLIKDLVDCQNDAHDEHSISFVKHISSDSTNYISLNISSLLREDKSNLWSKPKPISSDIMLSNGNIDYSKPIDAIFQTDNTGEVFFIQGDFYFGIEFHESCPQQRDEIKVYEKRKLSELNVFGSVDSAYYQPNEGRIDSNPILFLTNYDKNQYFRLEIDSNQSKKGQLVSIKTSTHPISSHPIFSRICAPDNLRTNSSHLSAEGLLNGMPSNEWRAVHFISFSTIILCFISHFIH